MRKRPPSPADAVETESHLSRRIVSNSRAHREKRSQQSVPWNTKSSYLRGGVASLKNRHLSDLPSFGYADGGVNDDDNVMRRQKDVKVKSQTLDDVEDRPQFLNDNSNDVRWDQNTEGIEQESELERDSHKQRKAKPRGRMST